MNGIGGDAYGASKEILSGVVPGDSIERMIIGALIGLRFGIGC